MQRVSRGVDEKNAQSKQAKITICTPISYLKECVRKQRKQNCIEINDRPGLVRGRQSNIMEHIYNRT